MTISLVETPEAMEADGTLEGRYMAALAREGTDAFIANAVSRTALLRSGGLSLPVTIDDGGLGRSYVSSPHSAYVLYGRREMDLVGLRRGRGPAGVALALLDGLLRAARINRAVHLDNWLLPTNLHDGWTGDNLPDIRRFLAHRYPSHFLILRSLDLWSSPALLEAAREDGWMLLPARQVWVVEDLAREWKPRNAHGNDRRAVARSGLTIEDVSRLSVGDCGRIAELYAMLYIGKYSALNPVFTARFIAFTQETGLFTFRVAREASGRIMAVAGMLARGGIMTPPVVGYDTSRPRREALYRIACYMFTDWAMARGLRLHGSAGAADFKRLRGAKGVIEYMAVHGGHLSAARQAPVRLLARLLEHYVVPLMKREGW